MRRLRCPRMGAPNSSSNAGGWSRKSPDQAGRNGSFLAYSTGLSTGFSRGILVRRIDHEHSFEEAAPGSRLHAMRQGLCRPGRTVRHVFPSEREGNTLWRTHRLARKCRRLDRVSRLRRIRPPAARTLSLLPRRRVADGPTLRPEPQGQLNRRSPGGRRHLGPFKVISPVGIHNPPYQQIAPTCTRLFPQHRIICRRFGDWGSGHA